MTQVTLYYDNRIQVEFWQSTVKFVLHLGLVASIVLAFAQAPFRHVHESDVFHEHAHGFTHAHLDHHSHDEHEHDGLVAEADDHDSDARLIDWLAGDGTSSIQFALVLPESMVEPTFPFQISRVPEQETRNHDPPALRLFIPRGPPV